MLALAVIKLLMVALVIVVVARVEVPSTTDELVVVAFVAMRFVTVSVPTLMFVAVMFVKNALTEDSKVEKKLLEVPLLKVRLAMVALEIVVLASVEVPVTTNNPVVVELIVVTLLKDEGDETKSDPDTERFVVEAFPREVCPVTVKSAIVVVASEEAPSTVNVPLEVSDEVAVMAPPVRVFMVPVTAERMLAKKLVEVACPAVSLETVVVPRLVLDPSTAKLPVEVAFPLTSTVNLLFSVHPDPFQ
jgi:hypothetical protein